MTPPVIDARTVALFDVAVKAQHLARAKGRAERAIARGDTPARFLHDEVAQDMADRVHFFAGHFQSVAVLGDIGYDWATALMPKIATSAITIYDAPLTLDAFPLNPASCDLIIAPLWLHWVQDVPTMLTALRLALKPGGQLVGSLFGGESLIELKQCLAQAEDELTGGVHPRTSPSIDLRTLAGLVQGAGLAMPVADLDRITVQYPSALKLMKDLSDAGESNALTARSRTIPPRALIMRTAMIYAQRFESDDGQHVTATAEVLHFSGMVHAEQPR